MRSLDVARAACEHRHPGLLDTVEKQSLTEREGPTSLAAQVFRSHGGGGLLVPGQYGGHGAGPLDAVRVVRALGHACPSLAIMAVMHHFTVAMLFSLAGSTGRLTPAQREVLARIAPDNLLLASGWAEGRTNANVLVPSMTAEPTEGGYLVSGSKRPCSLSASMDILTASIALPAPGGQPALAMALIPAATPGITVKPFWGAPVLTATESNEIVLDRVRVPEDLIIRSTPADSARLDDLQTAGFIWFELLATAAYTGAASRLVAQLLDRARGSVTDRAAVSTALDAAVNLVEGTARAVQDGVHGDDAVAAVLVARYTAQDLLAEVTDKTVELLGGMAYISSPDVAYLAATVRALAFHPPSRSSVAEALVDYAAGQPLRMS